MSTPWPFTIDPAILPGDDPPGYVRAASRQAQLADVLLHVERAAFRLVHGEWTTAVAALESTKTATGAESPAARAAYEDAMHRQLVAQVKCAEARKARRVAYAALQRAWKLAYRTAKEEGRRT